MLCLYTECHKEISDIQWFLQCANNEIIWELIDDYKYVLYTTDWLLINSMVLRHDLSKAIISIKKSVCTASLISGRELVTAADSTPKYWLNADGTYCKKSTLCSELLILIDPPIHQSIVNTILKFSSERGERGNRKKWSDCLRKINFNLEATNHFISTRNKLPKLSYYTCFCLCIRKKGIASVCPSDIRSHSHTLCIVRFSSLFCF